jgi:hypothetical protein
MRLLKIKNHRKFFKCTPETILDAVERYGNWCTGRCLEKRGEERLGMFS